MQRLTKDAVEDWESFLRVLLELRKIGPTLPSVATAILAYLWLQPSHEAMQADLRQLLAISPQATSVLCHSLVRKGLVRLARSVKDGRMIQVQLTRKSLQLFGEK